MKIAVVASGFGGDTCEYPFAVCLAKDEVCAVEFGQPAIDLVEVSEGSLVDEESSVLLKRVRVRGRVRAGGDVTDMGDKGSALRLPCGGGEFQVCERREGLLGDYRYAAGVENADAGSVRFTPALLREAVGGLEQPERRGSSRQGHG
jgi:hypothetical protein